MLGAIGQRKIQAGGLMASRDRRPFHRRSEAGHSTHPRRWKVSAVAYDALPAHMPLCCSGDFFGGAVIDGVRSLVDAGGGGADAGKAKGIVGCETPGRCCKVPAATHRCQNNARGGSR